VRRESYSFYRMYDEVIPMSGNAELLHDLRMPLQLIYSCGQLLEAEVRENEHAKSYVEMLLSSTLQMQKMLTGAMEQLRPNSGAADFVRSDLVLRTWEAYTRCRLYAERRGVKLSFHSNADRLEMALDEEKTVRVLMNLVSNALKFTPEGGEVRIAVCALGDFAEISVSDNGCGIMPERMQTIFDLHETDGGYGYGLYIASRYARLMGGDLSAESEPGAGSTFTLRLPVLSLEAARFMSEAAAIQMD